MVLDIEKLSVKLPSHGAHIYPVSEMTFSVQPGETVCLVGESGSGKSVSMQSILGLIDSASFESHSSVTLDGESLLDIPEVQLRKIRGKRIAMIFQEPMTALNPVMTIGEQIEEVLALHAHDVQQSDHVKAIDLLAAVGIQDPSSRVNEYPHQLSGGMKQRVVIAMALAGKPDILIADEPTTALDVTIQAQVLSLIVRLQKEYQMGLILITHDLAVVSHIADTVAVMYAGELVEVASKAVFFKEPKHPYSQQLMACLPALHARNQPLATIPGRVPSLKHHFDSCRFAPRCPHAFERCHNEVPMLLQEDLTEVRCHLYTEEGAKKPTTVYKNTSSPAAKVSDQVLLKVDHLTVHFPVKTPFWKPRAYVKAIDGVSFELKLGSTLAIVGESGCGKTTLAKALIGLIPQRKGTVVFSGQVLHNRPNIQMVFQDPFSSLNPRMLIRDIISEGWDAQGLHRNAQERTQILTELLSQLGLAEDILDRYPHEFSGGQRQRIAIARALAMDPQLILCDEPTSALDVSVQAQIINLLKSIQAKRDISYLMISHNLAVVAYMADQIAVMYLGRIVEYGTVDDIMNHPRHPYTQALLASVPTLANQEQPFVAPKGEYPSPIHPPSGCHFHPRCPFAMDRCKVAYPPNYSPSPGVWVTCYLYDR